MSIMGEPSMASSPFTVKLHASWLASFTTHRPIGFGRLGLLQAKTPTLTFAACLFGITCKVFLSFFFLFSQSPFFSAPSRFIIALVFSLLP
jgi:hypothetical protein